jgi:hypothetical protein
MKVINGLLRLLLGIVSLVLLFVVLDGSFRVVNSYVENPFTTAILLAGAAMGLLTSYIVGSAIEQMVFDE